MRSLLVTGTVTLGIILLILIVFKARAQMAEVVKIQRFAKCPDTPNCVSSEAPEKDAHYVPPIAFTKSTDEAKRLLKEAIQGLPRATLVEEDGPYLHFEFRSGFFKFVDDVEFRFDEPSRSVRVRSASRTGRYDFGVNRKRIEEIRSLLQNRI